MANSPLAQYNCSGELSDRGSQSVSAPSRLLGSRAVSVARVETPTQSWD